MIGRVVSTKMNKTAAVLVTSSKTHLLYKKSFTRNKKFLAHDELGVKEGDIVEIVKVKPISLMKHWQIIKVIGKDLEEIAKAQLKKQATEVIEEVMPEVKEEVRTMSQELSEKTKIDSKNSKKKVIVDNSTLKSRSKKKGRTELSK